MEAMMAKKWKLELLWFIASLVLAAIILIPIYTQAKGYPYYLHNIIYVFCIVQFTRYIFLLRFTPFSHNLPFKLIVIFTAIPVLILLTDGMAEFQADWDNTGFEAFLGHLSPERFIKMNNYVRSQFMFLGVSSVIAGILLPLRMIVSIWRVKNKNTV